MRREEATRAIEARLDLVEDNQSAVRPTQGLCRLEVLRVGHADAALSLDGLDEECGEAFGFKLALQAVKLPERNSRCFGQKRSKSLAPKGIVHQGKRAASEPVEGPLGVKQAGAAGISARKLDRCFDSLTA